MERLVPLLCAAALGALAAAGPAAEDEAAKVLRTGGVGERLALVGRLAEGDDPAAEDLLVEALQDRDGEVVERACEALGRRGTDRSVRPLAELSFQAPSRRVRLAAAAALGARAPEAGARLVQSALGAKDDRIPSYAAEALAEIRHPAAKERLRLALRSEDPLARREAAQALGSLRDPSLLRDLEALLRDRDFGVRAGALEGIARIGDPAALPMLLSLLQEPDLPDLVERRVASAVRRVLWARRADEGAEAGRRKVLDAYRNEKGGAVSSRLARVLASIARAAPPPPPGAAPAGAVPTPGEGPADPAPEDGGGAPGAPPTDPSGGPAPAATAGADPPGSGPSLLEGEGPVGDPAPVVKALAEAGLVHREPVARRTAAWALGRVGGEEALGHLGRAVAEDADDLVRFHALRGWRRWRTARDDEAFQLFAKVLRYDRSKLVREEAAVGLAVKGLRGAADTLAAALKDRDWEVQVAAAVSLGKTRDPRALEILAPLLAAKDWRIRGAAAAGIGWACSRECPPLLIPVLSDPEPCVARTAWEFLKRLSDRDLPFKRTDWDAWWGEKGKSFEIVDREAEIRDARKYGYALNDRDVYENLDVVVLKSRGDTIQDLLKLLDIRYRLTQAANVKRDGVQPFGVFVSNCTGEMLDDDHARVQWFVHAGGALFGSCWAIDTTIGKEFPGTMRRTVRVKQEVLAQVRAEELPTESEYLRGVFPGVTRPVYELWGAYLIEVLDPEWLEVLIDSPDTATEFAATGNLAAWFSVGHGVVMGSSNHFDRQTMTKLQGARGVSLKTEKDRRAFAVDHFGFTWEKVRELDERGVFGRQSEAEKEVTDLSAFRFLTNFVRRKRIVDL